jgi:hypothetical protein
MLPFSCPSSSQTESSLTVPPKTLSWERFRVLFFADKVFGEGKFIYSRIKKTLSFSTVYGRRVNSFVLVCSLSSHRHLFIPLIFGSRFDS